MNITHPTIIGLKTFLLWAAFSCCWFLLAHSVARFAFAKLRVARLLFLVAFLAGWACLVPATTKAYIGNRADPRYADRREEYAARSSGKFYGAQTIWVWGWLIAIELPKLKRREVQAC